MTRRSSAILVVLLASGALATLLVLGASLRERLYLEHLATAQVALRSVGTTLTHARQVGVPLEQLVGLEELLRSRNVESSGIGAVRLLDARNHVVWRSQQHSILSAKVLEVRVDAGSKLQAEFVPPDDTLLVLRVTVMLLAIAVALALPLRELAAFSDLVGASFSDWCLGRQLEAVRKGDLRVAWRPAGVGSGDVRIHFVRDQVFLLNEQYQRVTRLVASLQRTEPDASRRQQMETLLAGLVRRFRFADGTGPIDRRVWPAAGTARCFAALTLLLANLSIGSGGNGPHLPTAAPYSPLAALTVWSLGLLLGTSLAAIRWPMRLRAGIAVAVLANVLMTLGAEWSDACAHAASGLATALAAGAALDAARAHVRPVSIAMLLAATIAGPVLGLAATVAFSPFADAAWLFGAAALVAAMTLAWLFYRLIDQSTASHRAAIQVPRIARGPLLAGVAWSAAIVAFIADTSGNREQALRLVILQLPGFLLLAGGRAPLRVFLAAGLAAVGAAQLLGPLLPPAWAVSLTPDHLAWVGAIFVAGAVAAPRGCRRHPVPAQTVAGFAAGALATYALVALLEWVWPHTRAQVALSAMVFALLAMFVLPESAKGRARR